MPDATTAAGVFLPPPSDTTDLPTRVDTPPMINPVVTSDSVGSQPEGTSAGIGMPRIFPSDYHFFFDSPLDSCIAAFRASIFSL